MYQGIRQRIYRLIPTTMCWSLWQERNNRVFNDYVEPSYKVYKRAKESTMFWARRCKGYKAIPEGSLVRDWHNVIWTG